MGKFSLALREATGAKTALVGSTGQESDRLRARATAFSALMRQRQERITEAARLAEIAAVEAEQSNELSALAGAYRVISVAALFRGDASAQTYCQKAYDLYCEMGDLVGQAHLANNLGVLAFYDGRWDETLRHYRQASNASRRVGDYVGAAQFDGNIAEVLVNQGRVDEAEPLLRDATRVLRSSGSPWLASFAELQLGRVLVVRGELGAAEILLRGLVVECYQMGVPASAYEVTLHLGECLVELDRAVEALAAIDDATARHSEDMSIFEGAEARVRARVLASLGRLEEAVAWIVRGVEVTRARTLEFDLARLLLLARELGADDSRIGHDLANEATRLLDRLGVRSAELTA